MFRVRPLCALFLILSTFGAHALARQTPRGETTTTAAAPPPAASAPRTEAERRREAFDIVWQTVRDNHFDPGFGGVDWEAARAEFAPRAASARSDRELHTLLQQMLNRLGKSHFNIIPPEAIPSTEAEDDFRDGEGEERAHGTEEPRRKGTLRAAAELSYGIGIDL